MFSQIALLGFRRKVTTAKEVSDGRNDSETTVPKPAKNSAYHPFPKRQSLNARSPEFQISQANLPRSSSDGGTSKKSGTFTHVNLVKRETSQQEEKGKTF